MLMRDGRFKLTREIGSGKLEMIDELRSQLSHIEKDEGSSLSLFRKDLSKSSKRESKARMIDDDVLKSYDMVENIQQQYHEAESSEKRELQRKRSMAEKSAS